MPRFPDIYLPVPPTVTILTTSKEAAPFGTTATPVSAVWPSANLSLGYEFHIHSPITVYKLFWFNGNTVNGSVDCGIYDPYGTLLVSTGIKAQSTTGTMQVIDLSTPYELDAGAYFLMLASSSATNTFLRRSTGIAVMRALGGVSVANNFPLQNGVTFAPYNTSNSPVFGLSTRSVT